MEASAVRIYGAHMCTAARRGAREVALSPPLPYRPARRGCSEGPSYCQRYGSSGSSSAWTRSESTTGGAGRQTVAGLSGGSDGLMEYDELITPGRLQELLQAAMDDPWDADGNPFAVIDIASIPCTAAEADALLSETEGYGLAARHDQVSSALGLVLGSSGEPAQHSTPSPRRSVERDVALDPHCLFGSCFGPRPDSHPGPFPSTQPSAPLPLPLPLFVPLSSAFLISCHVPPPPPPGCSSSGPPRSPCPLPLLPIP